MELRLGMSETLSRAIAWNNKNQAIVVAKALIFLKTMELPPIRFLVAQ